MRVDLQAIAAKACFHKVPFPILDALAAVAPAIKAAALERAAVVAEQLPSPDFIYDWPDAIAAAIRALKETT